MSETFIPLTAATASSGEGGAVELKVLSQAEAALFQPLACAAAPPAAPACARASVTLQRQGDVVSGIRIECGCGQVIELACVF